MKLEEMLALERIVEEENDWRHRPPNRYTEKGLSLVSKISSEGRDLKSAIKESVDLIGGFRRSLDPGDRVFLMPNFNNANPSPASIDIPFLAAVVELLQEEGITDLSMGGRSGWPYEPTAGVFREKGLYPVAEKLNLAVIDFDFGPWMDVRLGEGARAWKKVTFHRSLKDFNKFVFLPCLKHHKGSGFTMSLKLPVGMIHHGEMANMHADKYQGRPDEPMFLKMIELCTVVGPDLILLDGRKAFVTDGPATGELVEPQILMASGDRMALDVEGVKVLQQYPRDNLLKAPVWEMPLIRRALELGLGARSEEEYLVVGAA